MTEYNTIPNVPNETTNRTIAVINAPVPKVRRPRELSGETSSSPTENTTLSVPVPNASPTRTLLQNSTVATANGTTPAIKIIHVSRTDNAANDAPSPAPDPETPEAPTAAVTTSASAIRFVVNTAAVWWSKREGISVKNDDAVGIYEQDIFERKRCDASDPRRASVYWFERRKDIALESFP